jgi:hypothetical protein
MDFDEEPLNGEGAEEGGAADISERRIVEASLPVSLLFARPRYSELVRAARGFIETYPENAVITAQVAVEVFVEMAFSRLLSEGDLPPPLAEAV